MAPFKLMALERAVTSGLQQEDQLTGRREDSCHDPVTGRGRRTLIDNASLRMLVFTFLGLLSRTRTAGMQGKCMSDFIRNGYVFHVTVPLRISTSQ